MTFNGFPKNRAQAAGLRSPMNGFPRGLPHQAIPPFGGLGPMAAYRRLMLNTPGCVAYWRMGNTLAERGPALTVTNAPLVVPGPLRRAYKFDGVSQWASAALDPSPYSVLSISWWQFNPTNGTTERVAFGNSAIGSGAGFIFEPRYTSAVASVTMHGSGGFWIDTFPQPSAAAWHHYLWVLNRTGPSHQVWVDGISQTLTTSLHTMGSSATGFDNVPLNFATYQTSAWYWACSLAEFAVCGGVSLTRKDALDQWAAGINA